MDGMPGAFGQTQPGSNVDTDKNSLSSNGQYVFGRAMLGAELTGCVALDGLNHFVGTLGELLRYVENTGIRLAGC